VTQLDVVQRKPASSTARRTQRDRVVERAVSASEGVSQRPWILSTLGLSLAGSLTMWLTLPPVGAWPLAWIAPMFWLVLVRRKELAGGRPYLKIYAAGLVYWLATLYWLTLPHWSASLGWLALSWYLAFYVPLFVAVCRLAVHRLNVPLFVAAPIVWTALEVVRGHFGGGFLMATLGHSQYPWLGLIQISDLVGAYGVSFVVMFVAACLTQMLPVGGRPRVIWPLVPMTAVLAGVLIYGNVRMADSPTRDGPTIALVQGTIDTKFGGDEKDLMARRERTIHQYYNLTTQALRNARQEDVEFDLIVWPESMFSAAQVVTYGKSGQEPPSLSRETPNGRAVESRTVIRRFANLMLRYAHAKRPAILFGADTAHFEDADSDPHYHSTSLLVDASGELVDQYHKMHPVMFGEYVPLGNFFPSLYGLTPLPGGLSAGKEPVAFEIADVMVAPNICYETVVPHLIRRQVAELTERGEEPEVLITQTNDGWFWGSAALDLHLICGVFRAVECRKPLLIAANTGISAWIDSNGQLVEQCQRRQEQVIVARPKLDDRHSLYVAGGDWFGWSCVVLTGLLIPFGWLRGAEGREARTAVSDEMSVNRPDEGSDPSD